MNMHLLSNIQVENICKEYAKNKFSVLRNFIPQKESKKILDETLEYNYREVMCGIKDVKWLEASIPEASDINKRIFTNPKLLECLKLCLNTERKLSSIPWISRYRSNEYINKHKDSAGNIQLLICLKNSGKDDEGKLHLISNNQNFSFKLACGDLVIFKASELAHYTTPITSENFETLRVTAVCRYFIN